MYVLLKHNTMIIKLKTDVLTFYSLTNKYSSLQM